MARDSAQLSSPQHHLLLPPLCPFWMCHVVEAGAQAARAGCGLLREPTGQLRGV